MIDNRPIQFDPFTLDPANELLWKGEEKVRLRPKTFALLRHLALRPGALVTKTDLLNAVWGECNVGDEALKHCVAEIRRALDDRAEAPRFVETVHRRGYRFIGRTARVGSLRKIGAGGRDRATAAPAPEIAPVAAAEARRAEDAFVGRGAELATLHRALAEATAGRRQVVFVGGAQGMGKTRLVDAFVDSVRPAAPGRQNALRPMVARGQCLHSLGSGEAYMPVLEAVTALGASGHKRAVLPVLYRHAPLWLAQMPALIPAADLARVRRATLDASRQRMLREMAEALEALTADRPLILVLEDLHWSDSATLDLVSYWAQRRGPARLLLVGTYRTGETAEDHPLGEILNELQAHRQCLSIGLGLLGETEMADYLARRFPGHRFPEETAPWLARRTGGHPLFLVKVLDRMCERGFARQQDGHWRLGVPLEEAARLVPPTAGQVIERWLDRCTMEERGLLEAASVEGEEFSAAAVAAMLRKKPGRIESRLRDLAARRDFLSAAAPTGTDGNGRYRFTSTLRRDVCYRLLPGETRALYHLRAARHLERSRPDGDGDPAALLARHYDRAGEPGRALPFYAGAAESALARFAGHEALEEAGRGLELLAAVAGPRRAEHEARLRNALGEALWITRGAGAKEVLRSFERALEIHSGWRPDRGARQGELLFRSLYGLWSYHRVRAEPGRAHELAGRLLGLAEAGGNASLLDRARHALGSTLFDHGEFTAARTHLERSRSPLSRSLHALLQWHLGFPDRALEAVAGVLSPARTDPQAGIAIFAGLCKAWIHKERREPQAALDCAEESLRLGRARRLPESWLAPAVSIRGWALARLGQVHHGLEESRRALGASDAAGALGLAPLLLDVFAEICLEAGKAGEGLEAVDRALEIARRTGTHHHDAELHRIRGELLARRIVREGGDRDPAACFQRAIRTAQDQGSLSLQLRAAVSLAVYMRERGGETEARARLERLYGRFGEGFGTGDLMEARALLGS
jgi:DNA-binding winged helix-turn-helix (wHTH) protein/tetratricopeptide (TPR) repeat protein